MATHIRKSTFSSVKYSNKSAKRTSFRCSGEYAKKAKNANPAAKNTILRISWHIAQDGFALGWFLLLIIRFWLVWAG